jgi:hypothetical protein
MFLIDVLVEVLYSEEQISNETTHSIRANVPAFRKVTDVL